MSEQIHWERRYGTLVCMYQGADHIGVVMFKSRTLEFGRFSFLGMTESSPLPPELDDLKNPEPALRYIEALWRMQT